MAWQYCVKCGEGMNQPTVKQALDDDYRCPSCGIKNYNNSWTAGKAVESLEDRIAELERRLNEFLESR